VIVAMFSLQDRPQGLPQTLAADVLFQGKVAIDTIGQIVSATPDRRAGMLGDRTEANIVAHSFASSGFRTVIDPFTGGGKQLVNVVARRPGGSRRQIVVIAPRDAVSVPDATGSAADTRPSWRSRACSRALRRERRSCSPPWTGERSATSACAGCSPSCPTATRSRRRS